MSHVAALDRYHELAAGPPPRRPSEAPPLALPTPPKALTFAAPPAGDEPFPVDKDARDAAEVAGGAAEEVPQLRVARRRPAAR